MKITELVFILDKSGSMSGMEQDTIGGFNAMIEKQRMEEGEALVSTILFSTYSKVIHDRVRVGEVAPLTRNDYAVGGCTALLDAIGDAIKHVSKVHKYARPEDVPDKTIFIITTDGFENASRKWNSKEIKELVSQKEKDGWEFLFLGANIDAVETASGLGIREDRAVNYCVKEDTTNMFMEIGETVSCFRKTGNVDEKWARKVERNLRDKNKKS